MLLIFWAFVALCWIYCSLLACCFDLLSLGATSALSASWSSLVLVDLGNGLYAMCILWGSHSSRKDQVVSRSDSVQFPRLSSSIRRHCPSAPICLRPSWWSRPSVVASLLLDTSKSLYTAQCRASEARRWDYSSCLCTAWCRPSSTRTLYESEEACLELQCICPDSLRWLPDSLQARASESVGCWGWIWRGWQAALWLECRCSQGRS